MLLITGSPYKGTVTGRDTARAHSWGIKLCSPERSNDIKNWKFADADIESSFFWPRLRESQYFELKVYHDRNGPVHVLSR
jgi:hypothetical protein